MHGPVSRRAPSVGAAAYGCAPHEREPIHGREPRVGALRYGCTRRARLPVHGRVTARRTGAGVWLRAQCTRAGALPRAARRGGGLWPREEESGFAGGSAGRGGNAAVFPGAGKCQDHVLVELHRLASSAKRGAGEVDGLTDVQRHLTVAVDLVGASPEKPQVRAVRAGADAVHGLVREWKPRTAAGRGGGVDRLAAEATAAEDDALRDDTGGRAGGDGLLADRGELPGSVQVRRRLLANSGAEEGEQRAERGAGKEAAADEQAGEAPLAAALARTVVLRGL